MASRILLRPQTLGLGLGVSLFTAFHITQARQRPLKLDSSPDFYGGRGNAKTPVSVSKSVGGLNKAAVRQISSGSVIGFCAGVLVSTFSRSLALMLGLLVVGVQWAQSYGIHIIPYGWLQRYFTSMDLRSAVQENVAFKLSFGTTFAMAAFMHF